MLRLRDRLARRRGDLRLEPREFLQHHVGAEHEIARVPQIAALDEGRAPLLVRLLDEALDAAHLRIDAPAARRGGYSRSRSPDGRRTPKVTISPASAATAGLGAEFARNCVPSLNDVVGGQHRDDGLGIAHRRPGRAGADGRGAVAPFRLEQDRRLGADLLQLLGDAEAIVEIGDDDRRVEDRPVADELDDRLEGRPVADQRNELLGQALPQFRPDAGARAAAHDHRLNPAHRFSVLSMLRRRNPPDF